MAGRRTATNTEPGSQARLFLFVRELRPQEVESQAIRQNPHRCVAVLRFFFKVPVPFFLIWSSAPLAQDCQPSSS